MKELHDLWDTIGSYLIWGLSALAALSIDLLNTNQVLVQGSKSVNEATTFLHVVDGHLFIWGLNSVDIMQLMVLFLTGAATVIKGIYDIKHHIERKRRKRRDDP